MSNIVANKKVLQEIMNEVDDIIIVYTVLYSSCSIIIV